PIQHGLGSVYDPFTAPRRDRGALPYLRSDQCLAYMHSVRDQALACLERVDVSDDAAPLLARGFVYELIARHEQQHSETILQTLQLMTSESYVPRVRTPVAGPGDPRDEMVLVEGGGFEMGAREGSFSYDNERRPHERELEAFWIDAQPVTNGQIREFIADGGYQRREWWSGEGWEWKEREGIGLPGY